MYRSLKRSMNTLWMFALSISLSLTGHVGVPAVSGRKVYTVLPPPKDYVPASGDGLWSPTDAQLVNNADEMPGKRPFHMHTSEPALHQSHRQCSRGAISQIILFTKKNITH